MTDPKRPDPTDTAPAPDEPALRELVRRTEGLQPWRRVFHASWGLLIAGLLLWLEPSRGVAVGVLGATAALQLTVDLVRLRSARWNVLFFRVFQLFASPREEGRIASSTWYILGVLLAVALFPLAAAVGGILVLALADPAASYLGRRWGRIRVGDGSLEGTLAFLIVGTAVLAPVWGLGTAAAATLAAALVERAPWPLDDNLTLPVAAGAVLWWLGG